MTSNVIEQPIETVEAPHPNFLEQFYENVLDHLQSLTVLISATFAIGAIIVLIMTDHLFMAFPDMYRDSYQAVTNQLANQIVGTPSQSQMLKMMSQYNLSWLYITNASGVVEPATRPYSPELKNASEKKPHIVNWKGEDYFEAVATIGNGRYLHAGFANSPLLGDLTNQSIFAAAPLRGGYLLIAWIGLFIILIFMLKDAVSRPLRHLAQACGSLLLSREAYSGVTGGGLNVGMFTPSEVRKIATGLKEIRRQHDVQFFARVQKEEELKQQKKDHEITHGKLTEEFEKKFAQTQQYVSELHAKESEDEFISTLNHSIAAVRSTHQIYRTILDRLNDKYPTSIVHAAFFSVDRGQYAVDAFIGFDDRSLKALRAVNHTVLGHELFDMGSHIQLGLDGIRERGLQEVAQQLSLKSVAYFPLSFQNRDLGMLAVYFNIEGQSVLDRIRVLRKVADLTSRHLYQIAVYIEELEAARTDPLTGLRNKKYFYELAPQVFQRASVDPANSHVSFLLVDGDCFKQINDTFGHQVGDEVLRELSATIKKCVRLNTDGSRPVDCVIRFGGEEFLVILEKTTQENAMVVGERIRSAVEKREYWPGGTAHWTVSVGIATYPDDGANVEDLLFQADTALYYVKHELGRNKVCHASNVPKTFKWAKTHAKIIGELGVFEPSALLQALAHAQKTGVLTIQTSKDQQFWMLFKNGKPLQARTGNLKGVNAIVELMTTFEEGTFKFQEQGPGGLPSLFPHLDESFNINEELTKCLLDAALIKDKFDIAKSIISSGDARLTLVQKEEFMARWQVLKDLPEPPTDDELELMVEISTNLDGATPINSILKSLDSKPTAVLWHVAAFLVQHGLAQNRSNH
jgi:diguanylate cyclase (GGDEF)-like protein